MNTLGVSVGRGDPGLDLPVGVTVLSADVGDTPDGRDSANRRRRWGVFKGASGGDGAVSANGDREMVSWDRSKGELESQKYSYVI